MEHVHKHGFIHRDTKPENMTIGKGRKENELFMIDFGLAKRYKHPTTGRHIPIKYDKSLIGTARYASLNAHRGIELSRRDDLEELCYLAIYLLKGQLPWQDIPAGSKEEKYQHIFMVKENTPIYVLCEDCPGKFLYTHESQLSSIKLWNISEV